MESLSKNFIDQFLAAQFRIQLKISDFEEEILNLLSDKNANNFNEDDIIFLYSTYCSWLQKERHMDNNNIVNYLGEKGLLPTDKHKELMLNRLNYCTTPDQNIAKNLVNDLNKWIANQLKESKDRFLSTFLHSVQSKLNDKNFNPKVQAKAITMTIYSELKKYDVSASSKEELEAIIKKYGMEKSIQPDNEPKKKTKSNELCK